jgi:phosphatidylserine decarboxylase
MAQPPESPVIDAKPIELRDTLNFWLTNRLPRNLLTRFMGWFSKIRSPMLARVTISIWQWFVDDLRLHEARKQRFDSLHDCFTRELKPGARPIDTDPEVMVSPCDAEIGEFGRIEGDRLYQAKGLSYSLEELLGDPLLAQQYQEGCFVTLRLKSSMYHRFHAPDAGQLRQIKYIAGEVFNVNPPTLKRLPGVFVRNERAVLPLHIDGLGQVITLVPIAAILVASLRLHGLDDALNSNYDGPRRIPCRLSFRRGQELGWFEHGSTIVVLVRGGLRLHPGLESGRIIRMGQPLLIRPDARDSASSQ